MSTEQDASARRSKSHSAMSSSSAASTVKRSYSRPCSKKACSVSIAASVSPWSWRRALIKCTRSLVRGSGRDQLNISTDSYRTTVQHCAPCCQTLPVVASAPTVYSHRGRATDRMTSCSRSNHLHQHAFSPQPVELPIENLFPRAEVQPAFGNRDDDFSPHQLALDVDRKSTRLNSSHMS